MAGLFNIQLEADLSEFDSTVTDGGDLSQSAAAALAGTSGGLSLLIDDTTYIYGRKNITLSTSYLRFRFYIDINSLTMADGDNFRVVSINCSASPWLLTYISLIRSGAAYLIQVVANADNGAGRVLASVVVSDAEHYIEVMVKKASSDSANDGEIHWWIDGVFQSSRTDLDSYDGWSVVNSARLGAHSLDAGTTGTFYLDEFKANDDGGEIGAVVAGGAAPQMAYYRRRRV